MINSSGQQRLRAISPYMDRQDAISLAQQLQQHSRSTRYRLIDIRLETDPIDPTRARVVAISELIGSE
jgi:predicted GIY-YIG superfamily endonuclease